MPGMMFKPGDWYSCGCCHSAQYRHEGRAFEKREWQREVREESCSEEL